ncbi:DUF3833 family protein [Rhabdaerophilum sp. SD176]|uniref:DUF3833 family protein n=1 Tax=Rhabdaerophilum sp. SD176 TaxID=2983548 RepID=UPI0024DFCFFA|nr:DUF3833 family protein [Rhabdaerophilum sp. SD176]
MPVRHFTLALGLAALQASPAAAQSATLKLEDFFRGKTYAYGQFTAINGTSRSFRVDLTGRWDGKVLRLREDFVYTDGERDTKTWVFRKTSPTTYIGTREDVIGETLVTVSGNRADFAYDVNLNPKGEPNIVRFSDTLLLEADGTLRNTAWVSKFFIPVARVKVNFARTEPAARAIRPGH